jgi:glycosyltransferase involved in cell wall biosynthesis
MPTRARPQFALEAVELFLAQTWPNKQLVIVDDFSAPSFDVAPPGPGIVYITERVRSTIGAKRNRACAEARGDIICHWDDDDHSDPGRIANQVETLLAGPFEMTGYSEMVFRNGTRQWLYKGTDGYMLGTSLMYRKEYWRRRPFGDLNIGEDLLFQAGARSVSVPAGDLMWARTHPGNTSPRAVSDKRFTELQCA